MGTWALIDNNNFVADEIVATSSYASNLTTQYKWVIDISSVAPQPRVGDIFLPATTAFQSSSGFLIPPQITGYGGQQYATTFTLTDGATIVWDVSIAQAGRVTLGGNRTIQINNTTDGGSYTLIVIQDGIGSRTLSYSGARIIWSGGTAPTLSTAAGAIDILVFVGHSGGILLGSSQTNFK